MLWPALAGLAWGVVALLLAGRAFGPPIWGGVFAAPVIGILVARLTQDRFERLSGYRRGLVALASVYLGALCFALAIGLYDWLSRATTARAPLEVIGQAIVSVLWGVTGTGFLILFWPLAYVTHLALEWADA